MSAPVVWAILNPRGQIISGIYEHRDDAKHDCDERNAALRDHYDVQGSYCSLQAFAFIPDSLKQ